MRRSDPTFQGEGGVIPGEGGVVNAASDAVYAGFEAILAEAADIFHPTPFIHVGCDETSTPTSLPGYADFAKRHGISGADDLFAYWVKRQADAVRALNKTAMLWGPASLARLQPGDAIVMAWQGASSDATAAIARGLLAVNCPNGGANVSQEFGRAVADFGEPATQPNAGATLPPAAAKSVLGVQANIWECGWGYANAPRPSFDGSLGPDSFVDQAVARAAGAWVQGWPKTANATAAFVQSYRLAQVAWGRLKPEACRS